MIILGATSDDVGTQLEELTRCLLEAKNYQNVELNAVGAGGQVIDIRAEFPVPNLGSQDHPEQLIGECKAHRDTINLPDWLKFIGKIHVEEVTTQVPIRGLFIALNGVNPNVRASYRALLDKKQRITLLDGQDLLAEMLTKFGSAGREAAATALKQLTNRQFTRMDVAYRGGRLYWVFTFEDGSVAILNGNATPLSSQELTAINPSLRRCLQDAAVIDLLAEKEANIRKLRIQKDVITRLFANGGLIENQDLKKDLTWASDAEIEPALTELIGRNWLVKSESDVWTFESKLRAGGFEEFAEVLRFFMRSFFTGQSFELMANSEWFAAIFDNRAIACMSKIQNGMRIPKKDEADMLWFVRHSPSALNYALNPDSMIVTHRDKGCVNQEAMEEQDAGRFLRMLIRGFSHDFAQSALANFYFKLRGLVEIEVEQITKIKEKAALLLECQTRQRTAIGEFTKDLGGGLGLIEVLNSAPEPWDWWKTIDGNTPSEPEKK